jgi:uncharacterized protein (TIGR02271 family)
MVQKAAYNEKNLSTAKGIIIGGISGGALYILFNLLYGIRFPDISWLGITICAIVGAIIGVLYKSYPSDSTDNTNSKQNPYKNSNEDVLNLREEQLDISKRRIQTAKVTTHKEIVTEEKNIIVPVTREDLVIEKTTFDPDDPNDLEGYTETIRIPISEEDIDIVKHKVELEDVSVYNNEYQEVKHVTETLKKEKLNIKTTGNVKIIDNDAEKSKNS